MQKQRMRLLALNGTHLRGWDESTYGDYTLNNNGVLYDAKKTSAGFGVIYDTKLLEMTEFISVSEKNAKAFIEAADAKLKLVITYARTENSDGSEYTDSIKELAECTRSSD